MSNINIDVIVVGAGASGIAASIVLARAGKKVVLIEKGLYAGAKNTSRGQVSISTLKELFPDFEGKIPLERAVFSHQFMILDKESSTTVSYKENQPTEYTLIRADFDRWCLEEAKKSGVYFVPETLVESLVIKENKVVGVKTSHEAIFAPITIIAEGANSLLVNQLHHRKKHQADKMMLSLKEVYSMDSSLINERLGLKQNEGKVIRLVGEPFSGVCGSGIISTNKDSLVLSVEVNLDSIKNSPIKPYDLLNKLKSHQDIAPIFRGGILKEYSAKLLPENMTLNSSKLYGDGFFVVGSAGGFVDNIHLNHINLSILSGKLAGESAILALEHGDFSENTLSVYKRKLKQGNILQDLKVNNIVTNFMKSNCNIFAGFYLPKINEFWGLFVKKDNHPKNLVYRNFLKKILKKRNIFAIFGDVIKLLCMLFGVCRK